MRTNWSLVSYHLPLFIVIALAGCATSPAKPVDVKASQVTVQELYQKGQYQEAVPLAEETLKAAEKTYGPDHMEVAKALNNLAQLYCNQGRYSEAEPLFKQSLDMMGKTLPSNHPYKATVLNNLARLYEAQGRYTEAMQLRTQ